MKVCVLTTSFPLYEGIAVGIHVMEKVKHLKKRGIDVQVIAPHHRGAKKCEVIDGVRVHRFQYMVPQGLQKLCYGPGIPTNLKNSFLAKIELPPFLLTFLISALIKGKKCDIIHAHWSLAGLVGVVASKILNKPVILMMHGAEVFVLEGNPVLKYVLKNIDCLICNSTFTLKKTIDIYRHRFYSVIPPGVNLRRFHPVENRERLFEKVKFNKNLPLIFSLGKFIERKGFRYLIEALAILIKEKNLKVQLMLGGRGPLKEELQRMKISKKIDGYVRFLGYIPDDELPAYYSAADMFVLPSIVDSRNDTEGLGVVLLESLACGTPCIASRVGGITDIIDDGINGYLVEQRNPQELAQKISFLLGNDRLRKKMGERGRKKIEAEFDWSKLAERIERIYKHLLRK